MKKDKKVKIFGKYLIIFVLLSFYYIYLYKAFCGYGFDSDDANLVMEGNDILHGNFFLSGWNLTGVSFVYTELPLYAFAAIFTGVSPQNAMMAGSLAIFLLVLVCAFYIIKKDDLKRSIWGLLILFAISAFPNDLGIFARYHTPSIVEALLAFFFLNKWNEESKNKGKILYVIISTILFAMAAQSDQDSILIIIGPIFITSAWRVIKVFLKNGKFSMLYITHMIVSFAGIFLSFFTDKLFYAIGGANKNQFLDEKAFISFDSLGDKLILYFHSVLGVFAADFSNKQLLDLNTAFYFIKVIFILITMIFIIYNIVKWILQDKCDYISVVLSVGVIIVSFIYIFTNVSVNVNSARYIGSFPAIFSVIFVRTFRNFDIDYDKIHGLLGVKIVLLIVLALVSLKAILPLPSGEVVLSEQKKELADTLEQYGLTNGYASFWNASATTVISNNKVHVRAVIGNNTSISMHSWGCKTEWYKEPANFVVVSEDDPYGMTYNNMISVLGKPENVIEVNDLQILVYNYNIASLVLGVGSAFDDGILSGNEWYGDDTSYLSSDGIRIIRTSGMIWGPYDKLSAGKYVIICEGENLNNAEVDVFSNTAGMLLNREQIGEDNKIELNLEKDISDIEIRVYNTTEQDVKIKEFMIDKQE